MKHETAMQPLASIGVAVYTALLGLYPRAFRREFASDMIQDFEDASHDAWANDRWKGVLSLWVFTSADVARSALMQWLRSGRLLVTGLALVTATSCVAVVGVIDPRVPYTLTSSSPERDGLLVLILITTVVVIIAATVIFSLIFLRPALDRHAGRRRV
jgi:hypothetical protein